jgi:hypothetical protein
VTLKPVTDSVLRFVFTRRSGSTPVVKGNGASGVFAVDNRKIDRADHKNPQVFEFLSSS